MTDNMVARVARAICRAAAMDTGYTGTILTLDQFVNTVWCDYLPEARAAIKAMRTPTEAMILAVEDVDREVEALKIWPAMIDAALVDSTP